MEQTQKPIAKFAAGGVSAALWENEITMNGGKTAKIMKASVSRRYKDNYDNWKTTYTFSRNEIPLAIYCLQKVFETIVEKGKDQEITQAIEEEKVM